MTRIITIVVFTALVALVYKWEKASALRSTLGSSEHTIRRIGTAEGAGTSDNSNSYSDPMHIDVKCHWVIRMIRTLISTALAIIAFALLIALIVVGYSDDNTIVAERPAAVISQEKLNYANWLHFEFQIVIDGEPVVSRWQAHHFISQWGLLFDPFYTDLIFVTNQARAYGFPDNVVLAWPRVGETNFSVLGINNEIKRNSYNIFRYGYSRCREDVIFIEDLGLTFPLTFVDLVFNWEKIYSILNPFTARVRHNIASEALWAELYINAINN